MTDSRQHAHYLLFLFAERQRVSSRSEKRDSGAKSQPPTGAVAPPEPAQKCARVTRNAGFTLVEVVVAMLIVTVGLLGLAMLFPAEIRMGGRAKVANGALQAAQRELDQIRQAIFAPSGSFIDMDNNTLDASCGGVPGTSCGNPLLADGTIDFFAAPAVGYSVQLQDGSGQSYSVRWNVTVTAGDGRKIVLGSMALNPPNGFPSVVHIQALVAR